MRAQIRAAGWVAVIVGAVVALGWSTPMAAFVQLLATTALIMGGTEHPLVSATSDDYGEDPGFVDAYVDGVRERYIIPTAAVRGDDTAGPVAVDSDYQRKAVYTPEQFWPLYGSSKFDDSVATGVDNLEGCAVGGSCRSLGYAGDPTDTTDYVVFGYSQSARIATLLKRRLAEAPPGTVPGVDDLSFVLIGNPNRPNGGILMRFKGLHIPILGVTFDGATPTDTGYRTVDISRQYDGWSDFPLYPLNPLATANAIAGIVYEHSDYFSPAVGDMQYQGHAGDTDYYLIPAERLPILIPLEQLGVPSPILTALDAPARVIIEWAYDRDPDDVGTPTRARLVNLSNPVPHLRDLAVAIPTGWDDGISEAKGDPDFRPFGTKPATSPYGVGGQDLPEPDADVGATSQTVDEEPAPVTKRDKTTAGPLRDVVRNPIGVDDTPKAVRAKEDRPVRKLVKELTGQRAEGRESNGATGHKVKDTVMRKVKDTARAKPTSTAKDAA